MRSDSYTELFGPAQFLTRNNRYLCRAAEGHHHTSMRNKKTFTQPKDSFFNLLNISFLYEFRASLAAVVMKLK